MAAVRLFQSMRRNGTAIGAWMVASAVRLVSPGGGRRRWPAQMIDSSHRKAASDAGLLVGHISTCVAEHRASSIEHRASNIAHRAPSIEAVEGVAGAEA
jgi:hypothetical protein